MKTSYNFLRVIFTFVTVFSMTLSTLQVQPEPALAQSQDGGIQRDYNAESGKVTRITGKGDEPLVVMSAMSADMTPAERSDVLVQTFAPEFGLTSPSEELTLADESQPDADRVVTKYQQVYNGVPVLGGELIVNASDKGELYSMNGEVSQGLSLDTVPAISVETAIDAAKQGMVKWYGGEKADYQHTDASLYIFDESILRPSPRPAELAWKVEMAPVDQGEPIRELVLVSAKTGNIPLHFNQVDTAWAIKTSDKHSDEKEQPSASAILPLSVPVLSAGTTWYVAITGNDSNSCLTPATPCLTINGAVAKATDGDSILVAIGVYTGGTTQVVKITKDLYLSGGWDSGFTVQSGFSIVDGQNTLRGIMVGNGSGSTPQQAVNATIDRFIIKNGNGDQASTNFYNAGGGIVGDHHGDLTIMNTAIYSNSAYARGGGIYSYYGTSLTVINTTIGNNTLIFSGAKGAGILTFSTNQLNIINSTIASNSSAGDGGGYQFERGTQLTLKNSIIANNTATNYPDCYAPNPPFGTLTVVSNGFNLVENPSGCQLPLGVGDITGQDPQMGSLDTAGYFPLLTGSPAIDSASPAAPGSGGQACEQRDQFGSLRPTDGNSDSTVRCDIGAYEKNPPAASVPTSIATNTGNSQFGVIGASYSAFSAIVKDQYDAPLPGVRVTYTAPASGASGMFIGTNNNEAPAFSAKDGTATAPTFTANNTVGSFTIQATVSGVATPAQFTFENYIPIAETVEIYAGDNQYAPPLSPFGTPLQALVRDQHGHPMSGVSVTFTAPESGASGVFSGTNTNSAIATTNANGIATAPAYTSNNVVGGYFVVATFSGAQSPVQFKITNILQISTYTANHGSSLPGTLLCQTDPACTNGANPDADSVHKFTIGIYELYLNSLGRNSIDNNNMSIISTVQYLSGLQNAYWSGSQMIYGDGYGFANADDIVAHELTHGVTQYESNLFYFYQSGAISESLSDVFGEYYDQTNGLGNDAPEVKWLLGEDLTGWTNAAPKPPLGQRSMSNPPIFGDPDKMTSTLYYKGTGDNGGVHWNSGVNNKAVYLMVDGGTFNNKTVTGIGWDKTAAIYYEAQTNLLTSGSDYSDLYYSLQQACTNLIGQKGITSADCAQVKNAIDAVQMNIRPGYNISLNVPLCPTGITTSPAVTLLQDSFETGADNWDVYGAWSADTQYAASGMVEMWGDDEPVNLDSTLTMKDGISLPQNTTPFLFFKHAFAFEYDSKGYYDGGVLEYSKDNGTTWIDAKPLFSSGKNYTGTVFKYPAGYESYGSALQGKMAFVGDSHGYVSSLYNLTSLAGQTVKFRWRFATDYIGYYWGWFVDDVSIYQCVGTPAIPVLQLPANNALTTDYTPKLDWADAAPAIHHYQVQIATDKNFTALVYDQNNLPTSDFTVPSDLTPNTTHYWRVRSFNAIDGTLGWSATRTFRTTLTPPVLVSPAEAFASKELRPVFDWDDVATATGYTIQVSRNQQFTQVIHTGNPVVSNYTPTVDLPKNTTLYWRVLTKGANGPSLYSNYRTLITPVLPPPTPVLTLPLTNALVTNYKPTFTWKAVVMPVGTTFQNYIIQVDDSADFGSPVINDNSPVTTSFTPLSDLTPNTKYYWRVRAVNTSGEMSNWSLVWTLRAAMLPPALVSPGDAFISKELRPLFDWDPPAGPGAITGYTIQIAKDNLFKVIVHTGNPTTSFYTPTVDLPKNLTLYWRVLAKGVNGPSLYSEVRSLTTPILPPPAPVLTLPATNALVTNYKPTFTWKPVVMPLGTTFQNYIIQVDDSADFGSPVINENTVVTTSFTPSTDLTLNTKYFWRVRAVNSSGEMSNWSAVWTLRGAILPPSVVAPADGATGIAKMPLLDWSDVAGNTGYVLQVYKKGATPVLVKSVTLATNVSQYQFITNLLPNTEYYWKVQTKSTNGPSLWSENFDFTTGP